MIAEQLPVASKLYCIVLYWVWQVNALRVNYLRNLDYEASQQRRKARKKSCGTVRLKKMNKRNRTHHSAPQTPTQ